MPGQSNQGENWKEFDALLQKTKQIILYWLTACWDMQREKNGGCRKCRIKKQCKKARFAIWGHDILALKEFLGELNNT